MPERDTFAGAGHRGPDLVSVMGRSKSFGELIDPLVPVVIGLGCLALLLAKNRDARRLWVLFSMVVCVVSGFLSVVVVRAILLVWRVR